MKRPLQLSLAIALALGVTDAFALGLGAIQVRSGLNQPLNAEIPVIQGSPGEAEGLIVQLASSEDFDRVGLDRSSIGVPIEFSLGKNARGEPVIRITSKDIVREPFLGFLVEANWPKGRLLREYTVLLDPPVMAPAVKGSSAIAVATKDPERAPTQALPATKPAPAAAVKPAAPKPVAAAPAPKAEPAPRAVGGNEYGPVAAGETLGEVARATRPDETVTVNQMMLALLKHNPRAFYRDNINALKRGAVLRIPSAEEISATGSAREAAATVRAQVEEWRGATSAAPTLVADTTPAATTATTATASRPAAGSSGTPRGERLALVPPREGKADQQSADRPSGGTASNGDAATKAELARVKEALTSREQESGELKSRVKDLEEIKGKNDKLIALQNSELAELRERLKALQDEAAKEAAKPAAASVAPPTVPVAPSAAATTPPAAAPAITKDDIWGDGDKAVAGTPATPAQGPASTTPATPPAPAATAGANEAGALPADATPAVTTPLADTGTKVDTPASATTPAASVEPAPAAKPASPPAKPPVAAKPAVTPPPAEPAKPWYLEPWALGAAGVGGLLLVLAGLAGMRKRKGAATVARPSIASTFGDSPIAGPVGVARVSDAEEEQLLEQVRSDPGNAGAHLELLSLYYAQRDTEKFEAAAEEMYAYVADPNQAEWREARAMGEELVPHNPLFGGQPDLTGMAGSDRSGSEDTFSFDDPPTGTPEPYEFHEPESATPGAFETTTMPAFDYDAPPATPAESFEFDLPPIEPSAEAPIVTEFDLEDERDEPAAIPADDEFFAGDDAIGTKLDLAKAYLDMGDPDGARAMLEEVIAEGNASQQGEARKLLGEIH